MATGSDHSKICLTSFNSLFPKTPCWTQRSPRYLLYKPSCSRFCLNFRCHGNRGNQGVNLDDAVKLAVPENHTLEPKITTLSCVQPELWQFKEFLNFPHRRHCNFSIFSRINQLNIKTRFSHAKMQFLEQNRVIWRIKRENWSNGCVYRGSDVTKQESPAIADKSVAVFGPCSFLVLAVFT